MQDGSIYEIIIECKMQRIWNQTTFSVIVEYTFFWKWRGHMALNLYGSASS